MAQSQNLKFIVTGAAQGIGRGLSRKLLQSGHKVFLVDMNKDELSHTCSTFEEHKIPSDSYSYGICNLRDRKSIKSVVEEASKFFGGTLDVLVNNAGIKWAHWQNGKQFWEDDGSIEDQWDAYVETNFSAPFLMSRYCVPLLKNSDNPNIIHISSYRARQSEPNQEGYASTKSGMLGLNHSMAVSLSPLGIRVNTILPGHINVDMENSKGDEEGQTWEGDLNKTTIDYHLTNRFGSVDDIYLAVDYLTKAGFVSGSELMVTGGVEKKKAHPSGMPLPPVKGVAD